MDQATFIGLLIGALVVLSGIATAVTSLIVKPIINLNKSITKLDDSIRHILDDNSTIRKRLDKHGMEIDENTQHLIRHDKDIERHDKDIERHDREIEELKKYSKED